MKKFCIVYRKSNPYPVRHIVKYFGFTNEKDFFDFYYDIYHKFDDDTIAVFDTYDEAIAFIEDLKKEVKTNDGR